MRFWIIALAILLAGCGESDVPAPRNFNQFPPLGMGVVYGLSGSQAALGQPSLQGVQLAADQAGGEVSLTVADAGPDPRQAVTTVLQANPSAVMGLTDSDQVLAAAPTATLTGRLFLTTGATSPLLPSQVPGVFLGCFGDNVQAAAGAQYAVSNLGARRAHILYDSRSSYTRLLETYFQTRYQQLGAQVVSKSSYASASELPSAIARLSGPADLVYFAAQPDEVVAGIAALRQSGFSGPILGGDAYDFPLLGLSQVYFTTHADLTSSDPQVVRFVTSYRSKYAQEPDAFAALGYDGVNLMLQLRALAGNNPANMRNSFLSLGRYRGVTGDFIYTTSGVPLKTVTVIAVQGGQRQTMAQLLPTDVPPPETPFLP